MESEILLLWVTEAEPSSTHVVVEMALGEQGAHAHEVTGPPGKCPHARV